jgi:hypothetical protein
MHRCCYRCPLFKTQESASLTSFFQAFVYDSAVGYVQSVLLSQLFKSELSEASQHKNKLQAAALFYCAL